MLQEILINKWFATENNKAVCYMCTKYFIERKGVLCSEGGVVLEKKTAFLPNTKFLLCVSLQAPAKRHSQHLTTRSRRIGDTEHTRWKSWAGFLRQSLWAPGGPKTFISSYKHKSTMKGADAAILTVTSISR